MKQTLTSYLRLQKLIKEALLVKEERTSTVSKSRAKSSVKQIEKGKRDDGMGKFDAKVFAVKDGKKTELKTLADFDKHSSGYEYSLEPLNESKTKDCGCGCGGCNKKSHSISITLTEAEEKTVDKFEALMKKGLPTAAQLKNLPPSEKDKELNEAIGVTIATLVLGAPGILKVLSYISQAVGWLFGANKGDGNMFSRGLMKASKWLHHKYIAGIAAGLKAAYPERYKNKNDKVVEGEAQIVYAGMLAVAIMATGIGAAHAATQVAKTLEVAHIGVDVADIVSIASELSSAGAAAV